MGLFERMTRVFKSNANAALDKATDPAKELELLVTEMEEQLRRARGETARTMAAGKQAAARLRAMAAERTTWTERAELAARKGDDELAKAALQKQAEIDATIVEARAEEKETSALVERQKAGLVTLEARLRKVKAKKGTVRAKVGLGRTADASASALDEFERLSDRVDSDEGAVDAASEVNAALAPAAETERKLAALDGKTDVDDRLAALKRKLEEPPR